jgi:hypothetical protein
MTIRAVATFSDGKTQEKTLTLNLNEAELSGIIEAPPEAVEKMRTESARHEILVHSIPLERCEVVPGSEIILKYGDMYEYGYGAYGVVPPPPGAATVVTGFFLLTEESMNPANDSSLERDGFPGLFDENGAARFGAALYPSYAYEEYDGSDGYVSVIENNGDGTFTGKTYKVPGRLILEILEKMK